MNTLPHSLYTANQTRELDRCTIERFGLPGFELMQQAGQAAFVLLCQRWPLARQIAVVCGSGNNGGDGVVLARLAHAQGLAVDLFMVGDVERLHGEALQAWQTLPEGLVAQPLPPVLSGYDVIVDALLGTGLQGEVRQPWRAAIETINRAATPVLALDIPSGLDADSGTVLGVAVRAGVTISFIGLNQGLFTGDGPSMAGEVFFAGLGVPGEAYQCVIPTAERFRFADYQGLFAPRRRSAHKGDFGHVLVVGGDEGMAGACRLAAEAALRCGAGLVSVATRRVHAPMISAQRPEIMSRAVEQVEDLPSLLERATVLVIGPGLGQGSWGREMMSAICGVAKPAVIDADGLNLLAQSPVYREDWVLTPHPAEAARLLGSTTGRVQADRFVAVRQLQQRYGGAVVLKGAGSLVCDGGRSIGVSVEGNPGMASAGMGDVLSGVIGALLAQGMAVGQAARVGVALHAAAADRAAASGERGLLASDLMPCLRTLVNPT